MKAYASTFLWARDAFYHPRLTCDIFSTYGYERIYLALKVPPGSIWVWGWKIWTHICVDYQKQVDHNPTHVSVLWGWIPRQSQIANSSAIIVGPKYPGIHSSSPHRFEGNVVERCIFSSLMKTTVAGATHHNDARDAQTRASVASPCRRDPCCLIDLRSANIWG